MPGSPTTQDRSGTRDVAPVRFAFRVCNHVGVLDEKYFVAQWLACTLPCQRFRRTPHGMLRMTRGQCGSLHLHRNGLAPSTPYRSPGALHRIPFIEVTPVASFTA
jgi:hypothetical protein